MFHWECMLYVPKWLVHVVVHVSLGVHVVCPQVAGACSGTCFTGSACVCPQVAGVSSSYSEQWHCLQL